jgi:KDO2-lipid IV(A) lauroyltransferase
MRKTRWGKTLRYAIARHGMPLFLWLLRRARRLGPERLLRLSGLIARLHMRLSQKTRQRGLRHLRIAFPQHSPQVLEKILLESLHNALFNGLYMGMIGAGAIGPGDVLQDARLSGLQHLEQALQGGRGVILLSGHLGNFPLLCSWLGVNGYPLSVVFRDGNASFHGFYGPWMRRMGIDPLPFKAEAELTHTILGALKQNRMVLLIIDQTKKQTGVPILFFGKPTTAAAGPAILARRAKAPVLPVFIHREGLVHHIEIQPAVPLTHTRDIHGDVQRHTQTFSDIIEAQVARHPEEWLWRYRRWRQ